MSINPSPKTQRKFQMLRRILSRIKSNGDVDSIILVSHDEAMIHLMSTSPIMKVVEEQIKKEDDNMKEAINDIGKLGASGTL